MIEGLKAREQIARALASRPTSPDAPAGLDNRVLSQLFRWWSFNEGWPRLSVAHLRDVLHEDFVFNGPVALHGREAFEARLETRDPRQQHAHVLRSIQVASTAEGGIRLAVDFDYIAAAPADGARRMPLAYDARFEGAEEGALFPLLRSLTPELKGETDAYAGSLSTYAEHRALATLYRYLALSEMSAPALDEEALLFAPHARLRASENEEASSPAELRGWLDVTVAHPRRARVSALEFQPLAGGMGLRVEVEWTVESGEPLALLRYELETRDGADRFAPIVALRVVEKPVA